MKKNKINQINNILTQARNSISDYCINQCHAKCCRIGKLILLNEKEIEFITQGEKNKFEKRKILQKTKNGNYTFNHQESKCPYLTDNFKCSEWKNKNRPKVCYDYPLFFIQNKFIVTSNTCPAINEGKLNTYLKKLEKLDLKII